MRFCSDHWTGLREAIEAEGISHLIARDGQAAAANMISEAQTGLRRENFDPLMGAHWAIINRIADNAPAVLFQDGCPICWIQDEHERTCIGAENGCVVTRQTFEDWIPSVAEFMREEYDRLVQEDRS